MLKTSLLTIALAASLANPAFATDEQDAKARAEAQRALNAQVMARPFDPGDTAKADAYAEEARKSNVVPVQMPPAYWQPGWTCANVAAYAYYQYGDYRNCVYYQYYYHRYW